MQDSEGMMLRFYVAEGARHDGVLTWEWLLHDDASGETVVIDPGTAQPVLDAAAARGWTITAIWNTHWHPDHVGGNAAIKAATGASVTGPEAERGKIAELDIEGSKEAVAE